MAFACASGSETHCLPFAKPVRKLREKVKAMRAVRSPALQPADIPEMGTAIFCMKHKVCARKDLAVKGR